jgi:Cof subfamily protein (haloacid dehalogenase superfamily)
MGQSIRLVILDIDGTINGDSNQINEPVKQAVKAAQAKGVKVGIATGRMYRSALRFHQEIKADVPLISYQGALIKDPSTQNVVGHWPVDLTYALSLIDDFAEYAAIAQVSVHLYMDDQLYVREITEQTEEYALRSGVDAISVGDLRQFLLAQSPENPPTKVLALCDSPDLVTKMLRELKQRYTPGELYLTKSVATFFEATNPIANKGTAVRHLAENLLGFERSEVMTVGDNFNDVEMLEYAGIGVAMGNAPQGVKDIADWVAPDVDADGAAAAIAKFVL